MLQRCLGRLVTVSCATLLSGCTAPVLGSNTVDRLIHPGDHGEHHLWLATGWGIGEDGLYTYTAHLRKDVTLHSGEAFDSHAKAANIDMWKADLSTTTLQVTGLDGDGVVGNQAIRFTPPIPARRPWGEERAVPTAEA